MKALFQWLDAVVPEASGGVFKLAYVLGRYTGDGNQVWLSVDDLGEKAGLTAKSVRAAILQLEELGFLSKRRVLAGEELPSGKTARRARLIYTLFFRGVSTGKEMNPEEINAEVSTVVQGDFFPSSGGVSPPRLSIDRSERLSESSTAGDFNLFWQAYPLKRSAAQAQRTWKKLGKAGQLPDLQTLLTAIENQKKWRQQCQEAGEWVESWAYPSTWLNASKWCDELEMPDTPSEPPPPTPEEIEEERQMLAFDVR